MPQWASTPFTCLRCTRRLLSAHPQPLPRSSIRIATPRTAARHFETDPTNHLLIVRHPSRAAKPHPIRAHLPSSPPADLLAPSELEALAHERNEEIAAYRQQQQEAVAASPSQDLSKLHPSFPRPHEPHRYGDGQLAPSDAQLARAHAFFARGSPRYVFTCARFRQFPADAPAPEVAFLGRSNVGKSSLLNALFGRRSRGSGDSADAGTAKVSNRAGKTRTMNVFLVGEGVEGGIKAPQTDMHGNVVKGADRERWIGPGRGVVVVDMPGHGHGSKVEWGEEILKYLTKRQQLRRVFVLVDAEHGLKGTDRQLLDLLEANGVPHQIVLSKADKLLLPKLRSNSKEKLKKGLAKLRAAQDKLMMELLEREKKGRGMPALGEILAVSSMKGVKDGAEKFDKLGINGLRWAILQAAGLGEI
ncbi:hypothetical protein SLS56_007580 [Neofusicoccum ribis]|uniref:EngB-type G domain-containing protein n=1 Tax=Neofusicoccum ribis TaxID=45134 RepID=A0ABR3SMN2_9PEZI